MSMRRRAVALCVLAAWTTVACASFVHGGLQDVGIGSTPWRAKVTVDGRPVGLTPVVARLTRNTKHSVRIELDGFLPFETTLGRRASGWMWGNFLLGGPFGVVFIGVDALTGALFALAPDEVIGQLAKRGSSTGNGTADGFHVVLVERADSRWTRIGHLRRR